MYLGVEREANHHSPLEFFSGKTKILTMPRFKIQPQELDDTSENNV